ncbi:hypothetical protein Ancab_014875, partial [Ancistrocladus abbreviatus]
MVSLSLWKLVLSCDFSAIVFLVDSEHHDQELGGRMEVKNDAAVVECWVDQIHVASLTLVGYVVDIDDLTISVSHARIITTCQQEGSLGEECSEEGDKKKSSEKYEDTSSNAKSRVYIEVMTPPSKVLPYASKDTRRPLPKDVYTIEFVY